MFLSRSFFKLMCMGEVGYYIIQQYIEFFYRSVISFEFYYSDYSDFMIFSIEDKELIFDFSKFRQLEGVFWFVGILTEEDFDIVDLYRFNFFKQFREFVSRKQRILKDRSLFQDQKNIRFQRLVLYGQKFEGCRIEDFGQVLI